MERPDGGIQISIEGQSVEVESIVQGILDTTVEGFKLVVLEWSLLIPVTVGVSIIGPKNYVVSPLNC